MGDKRDQFLVTVHLILMRANQILLLRRFNTGYEGGKYSLIAGHVEHSEWVLDAMIREAREEAGIEIAGADLSITGVLQRKTTDERIDFFLAARTWSGEITNQEPDKCDDLAWFGLDRLPTNVIPYIRRAIENCQRQQGMWFDTFEDRLYSS